MSPLDVFLYAVAAVAGVILAPAVIVIAVTGIAGIVVLAIAAVVTIYEKVTQK